MIRIGIYDRYLSTLGGGERYSCKMAEILSRQIDYSVDLVTDIYSDLGKVSSRLNLDLSRVSLKVFPFLSEEYAKRITGNYDIFINATYLSSLPAFGKRNIYLCYFPTKFDVDFRFIHRFLLFFFRPCAVWLYRLADRINKDFKDIEVIEGLYDIKKFFLRRGSWSSGRAVLSYKNVVKPIRVGFKNPVTSKVNAMSCRISLIEPENKKIIYEKLITLKPGEKKIIEIPFGKFNGFETLKESGPVKESFNYILEIISDTFIPEQKTASFKDSRTLGAVLYCETDISIFKKVILKILGFVPLFLVSYPKDFKFLDSYNRILSISQYSKKWIRRLWGKESTILYPPVDVEDFAPAGKDNIILSVGRFFPEHHNKKQLEIAQNFIDLYTKNPEVMKKFTLCLAGGVENKTEHMDYVKSIIKLSEGFPIKVLTNIDWDKLVELFSRSLIFWHASGMGEDENRHPEKFEHFGITTVEAMASGCIPVVINKGGQTEIIQNGYNGFLFESWDELKEITLKICSGDTSFNSIKENAINSSKKFSSVNFERELLDLIQIEIDNINSI
ncbi:MAG: glycosyltransferase [Actinobacteria bacterium]|nr:glycosyltransferase [Actinomycetota bacterium]